MRRRIALLLFAVGLGVLPAPPTTEAQPRKVRIGYLSGNPAADTQDALEAFRKGLRDLGYVEGQNLVIEYRYADAKYDQLAQLAADLVRLKVDLILTYGTPASLAAKNATSTIPIVFGAVADPVVAGIVATLPRPGGNVTGTTTSNPELSGKRLQLLKEAIPKVARIAILANPSFQLTSSMVAETRAAAKSLGVQAHVIEVQEAAGLETAFNAMVSAKAGAVVVLPDPMFISQWRRIVELAATRRLPAISHLKEFAEAGGLMSYGPSYVEMFRNSAALVDKILKGRKPADLPVEQPTKFELVVNLKTARALGLTIPQSILIRAGEVIQ